PWERARPSWYPAVTVTVMTVTVMVMAVTVMADH
ncbi:uncharacterized protein METZ01_LOCUS219060, partial [marine metagenome]